MYNKIDAIINLPDATVIGSIVSTLIFIAKKEDPHIAPKIKRSKKIFDKNNYYFLLFGFGSGTFS